MDVAEIPSALLDRGRVLAVACDVSDHGAVGEAVETVVRELGPPDYLVNSAGIQLHAPALELSYEDWSRVLAINLGGTFSFCQAAGRFMVERGSGAIVNLASISMFFGFPKRLPYIVSKGGVGGLTQTLAVEWARTASGSTRWRRRDGDLDPRRRVGERRDRQGTHRAGPRSAASAGRGVAAAIAFLLSDAASFITGRSSASTAASAGARSDPLDPVAARP